MSTIIFRKNFEVKKYLFEEELINKFPFANEFYTAIFLKEGDFNDKFIEAILTKSKVKEEYFKLNREEKILAEELILSFLQLTPEFVYEEIKDLLSKESTLELEKLVEKRKRILEETPYFLICKPEKYFSGISEGALTSLEDNFLYEKKYNIIK
jgi:hypothetical protein